MIGVGEYGRSRKVKNEASSKIADNGDERTNERRSDNDESGRHRCHNTQYYSAHFTILFIEFY